MNKLKLWILQWLGLDTFIPSVQESFKNIAIELSELRVSSEESLSSLELGIGTVEKESISRDKSQIDTMRLNHESILNTVKDIATSHVEEHISRLHSPQSRFVSCPICSKSYNLATMGIAYSARAITIICEDCKTHFEIRPSLFWNKIEVEKR